LTSKPLKKKVDVRRGKEKQLKTSETMKAKRLKELRAMFLMTMKIEEHLRMTRALTRVLTLRTQKSPSSMKMKVMILEISPRKSIPLSLIKRKLRRNRGSRKKKIRRSAKQNERNKNHSKKKVVQRKLKMRTMRRKRLRSLSKMTPPSLLKKPPVELAKG
jgi:hypothetical protein